MPGAVLLHLCGKGLIREFHHHGLPGLHALRLTRKRDIRAFFRRVEHIVSGYGIDGDSHRIQVKLDRVFSRHGVAPGIFRADADGHASRRPCLKVRRRHANLPAAAGVNRGDVFDIIDGDGDLCAFGQMSAGAGYGQILLLLDGVNHVIARDRVHAQARQFGVDVDITFASAGIAVRIGDRGAEG